MSPQTARRVAAVFVVAATGWGATLAGRRAMAAVLAGSAALTRLKAVAGSDGREFTDAIVSEWHRQHINHRHGHGPRPTLASAIDAVTEQVTRGWGEVLIS